MCVCVCVCVCAIYISCACKQATDHLSGKLFSKRKKRNFIYEIKFDTFKNSDYLMFV